MQNPTSFHDAASPIDRTSRSRRRTRRCSISNSSAWRRESTRSSFRKSQRSRGQLVDEAIALDTEWRRRQIEVDKIRQELWRTSREIGKQEEDATELIQSSKEIKGRLAAKETEVQEARSTLHAKPGIDHLFGSHPIGYYI